LKPNTEPLPNRISEQRLPGAKRSFVVEDYCLVMMHCITGTGQLLSFSPIKKALEGALITHVLSHLL
jgi:hypothetical protein